MHRPNEGLIRLKLWEGKDMIEDSGNIFDNGLESLKGGRLGVYCDSQQEITWSALSYRWGFLSEAFVLNCLRFLDVREPEQSFYSSIHIVDDDV